MSEISLKQRRFIIEAYYSTKKSFTSSQRRFCTRYAIKKKQKAPSLQLISSIVQKFEKSGCVNICHNEGRGRSFLIKEKMNATFCQMAEAGDHVTVRKLADKTSCSATTAYKFLTSFDFFLTKFLSAKCWQNNISEVVICSHSGF